MIYKFRFEVYADDNDTLLTARSEESGYFWWAFTTFIHYIMAYATQNRLDRKE